MFNGTETRTYLHVGFELHPSLILLQVESKSERGSAAASDADETRIDEGVILKALMDDSLGNLNRGRLLLDSVRRVYCGRCGRADSLRRFDKGRRSLGSYRFNIAHSPG